MSFNQSRSDKNDSSLYGKSGRSASINNPRSSSGASVKGGAPAPSPAVSSSTNQSFKKPSNAQPVQSRVNTVGPNPNSGTRHATAPPHNAPNNSSSNPQIRGPSNAPLASTVAKLTEATAAPHRGTPIVPKAPASQSTSMSSNVTAPATPVKGDATAAFSFQFGSLSPGIVNLQIPARTSSAPPNINEQRQAQARQDAAKVVPPVPVPPVSRLQPHKRDPASAERVNTDASLISKGKPDTHQPVPSVVQPQKAHVHPVPATSMRMNFHQPQVPVHFSGPNPQSQPQVFPASSMPMPVPIHMPVPNAPQVQQQMFVQGIQSHPMQHQGIIHQGQNLSFAHQVNPQLGNLGMGIGQYSQQQGGQFSGARKSAVKITHPDTHQEVRLDSRSDAFSDGVPSSRSHPSMPPQSQTISAYPSNHQIHNFHNYTSGGLFYTAPSSLPLAGPQINTVSQGSRFGYPVGQNPQTASFVNSQASNSTAPGKVGTTIQGPIEQITQDHLQNIRDATYSSSFAVPRVTVKQAEPGGETKPSSVPNSSAAVSIELPKVLRPSSGHRQRESGSAVSSPKQKPEKELPVAELQSVKTEQYSKKKKLHDFSYANPESGNSADVSPEVSPSTVVNAEDSKKENFTGSNFLGDQVKKQSHIDNSQLHLQVEGRGKSSRVSSSTSCPSSEAVEGLETQATSLATPGINEGVISEPSQTNVATATSNSEVSDTVEGSRSASSEISEAEIVDSAKSDLQVKIAQSIPEVVSEKSEQDAVNNREINSTTDCPEVSASSAESATFSSSSVSPHGDDVSNGTAHGSFRMGNEVVAGSTDAEVPVKTTVDGDARESTAVKERPTQVVASNDKPGPELNRSKSNVSTGKKKRREILQKADAAGTTSDLYMAYKGPEGKKEAVVTSGSADLSSSIGPSQPHGNALLEETSVNEEVVHSKAEPDDWEDAADISAPKLEDSVSEKDVLPDIDDENASMTKKYSRDFLMKFAERYTNLPEKFVVNPENAEALSPGVNMSHSVDRDAHPSPRRGMERQGGGPRLDRRGSNLGEEDRWNKAAAGSFGPGRDMHADIGFNNNVGFRPGQGANYGALRNPHPQSPGQDTGGILSGPVQPPVYQGGIQRNGSDADRWQRAVVLHQKGLFPSPQTPHKMMHRAEKKYEIGKVTDEEQAKQRQLKAILNKLTPQNFEKLFEQVLAVNIDNSVTLTGLISQIFDKALMEPTFCEMYANLCAHLSQELPDLSDDNEKITFKRLLLNKCQEEFERGEREQEEADKVEEEGEVKQSEEQREEKRIKARRRMLGNIRLIGELYKKKMLTEKIMHECMRKLLLQYQTPHEEDLEALCKLMSTIGEMIDHPKAKDHMDAYFDRMAGLSNNMDLSSRVRFMLKDAIDLRRNKWQQRRKVEGPKKIDEVHRDAAQERHAQASRVARSPSMNLSGRRGSQMDFAPRGSMLSSPSSQIGGYRGLPSQARGYGAQDARYEERQTYEARTLSVPLPQRSMGGDSITLGPQGGLGRGMSVRGTPLNANPSAADVSSASGDSRRGPGGLNFFSSVERTSYNSREDSSGRFTGDRYQGSASDKWNVQGSRDLRSPDYSFDRSGPSSQPARGNGPSLAQNVPTEKVLPEEKLRHSSIETIKEYYSLKNLEEVVQCIKDLNSPSFFQTMVSVWVNDSFERKDKDRDALTELLIKLNKSQDTMVTQLQLIQGFELVLITLEDTVTDAPKAAEFLGRMFGKVVVENVVPLSEIGRILHDGGEQPGQLLEAGLAADVLGSTLEMINSDKGEAALKEIRRSSNLRLEDFRPPGKVRSRVLEKFI